MSGKIKFIENKKRGFSEKERKTLNVRVNGRSADFIMPSFAIGCELGCLYCYVARNRELGNPLTVYTNVDKLISAVENHWKKLPAKTPNQCDPYKWTYDIGESTDCLSPKVVATTNKIVQYLTSKTEAKPTFATKLSTGPKVLLPVKENSARVRISLMPQKVASRVEVGTSRIDARIESIDSLLNLGYEVHLNFSPVIVYKDWILDYLELFKLIDSKISLKAKKQLKAEVIFLTHSPKLHELNLQVDPYAEAIMWQPSIQEFKTNNRNQADVLRYKVDLKRELINDFQLALNSVMPYCKIRYIF